MKVLFLIFMFLLGSILGSFACCQARRLRARELSGRAPQPSSRQTSRNTPRTPRYGRWSICEACGKRLKWSENIPLLSWLIQRGRCKNCQAKIGLAEPLSELGLALVFLALGFKFLPDLGLASNLAPGLISSPASDPVLAANLAFTLIRLVLLIALFTSLTICFVYDALWGSFPSKILYLNIALTAIYLALDFFALNITTSFTTSPNALSIPSFLAALGILPGVYYLLYLFSKETLVGSGDWLLCLPLALVLHDFWLVFLVLFLSNFLAALVNVPLALSAKDKKRSREFPFGPFLITAFLIVYLASEFFIKVAVII